jgi:5-methylcytosine-specific restriction endonuclease McrA
MPCDYSKYPVNWKTEIRPAILERCGHKCFFCGVKNYDTGYRDVDGKFYSSELIISSLEDRGYDYFSHELSNCFDKKGEPTMPIKIVLTIMHLDHDTTNNDYNNLAAGCQKCHLSFDKNHHIKNARDTREKKKGLQNLF